MTLSLDYTFMLADAVSGGVAPDGFAAAQPAFAAAHAAVSARRASGELGFFDLPTNHALAAQVLEFAQRVRGRYQDIVLLGIGGSALGPIALRNALRPTQWNSLSREGRDGLPRLHMLDNVDPVTIAAVLERIHLSETLFLVVSKSGGTAETMAQYLIVRARLESAQLTLEQHLVFVTDPLKGALRPIANAERIPALDIPANIGGRFSVLSPVGTLPAALIGIDIEALLAGAGDMVTRCESEALGRNPAGVFATLQWLADTTGGKSINVVMPYADPLRSATWHLGSFSSGPRAWARCVGPEITSDRLLSRRSARPTSTRRCSCSWRGRSTRR